METTGYTSKTIKKIIREEGEGAILTEEKGYNTYRKVKEEKCAVAQLWWNDNKENWIPVREAWDDVIEEKEELELRKRVEDKLLYQHFFDEEYDFRGNKISALLGRYVK